MTLNANDDANERTKLLNARFHIEQLLKGLDLCADVVLAGRGRVEVFSVLGATWSRVWLEDMPDDGGAILRVRSKLADYGGDKDRQRADLEFTTGMVSTFAQVKAEHAIAWLHAAEIVDGLTGSEHTPLRREPKQ